MTSRKQTNRLAAETSPYLQQHAHNPVDWYPWGPEALERARREQKPILLSIGYSACHWCHVMAHESFEDPDTAQLMNELFVNIKVDREERPDLDKIYQVAHQLLTQRSGGWPLTMFLAPENQVPFFGGTYFPRESRYGLPSFREVLRRVAEFYHENREQLLAQSGSLVGALQSLAAMPPVPGELNRQPLDAARRQSEQSFDARHGGFGQAPKFPHPTSIERLLRHWAATSAAGRPDDRALHIATFTLRRMALGGIYDQLGGGFARYSVDERWAIPHFEKMLYDNAQLLPLYANAWRATGNELFRRIAVETGAWVMREMQAPEGGYYSTLDADSEGEEGRFYVWDREEIRSLLSAEEYAVAARRFGLDRAPNFEGRWHLNVHADEDELARAFGLTRERITETLESVRRKLFEARERRVRPGRDEKILTAWNGLMIRGMAIAGRRLGREDFIRSAERALDFIRDTLWRDGRLLATYKDGRAHLNAYLDDYAFLLDGTLELLQARWRGANLNFAVELAEALLHHFEDRERGGFYFTADDHETLIQRPKPLADDATPSGNGIAAFALGRLGHLLGEVRYLEAAERTLKAAWGSLQQLPYAHEALLIALEEYLTPPQTVILHGQPDLLKPWQARSIRPYAPARLTLALPATAQDLPAALAQYAVKDAVTAYICTGNTCSPPITSLDDLDARLRENEALSHETASI
ncbi:MAG: thioredoxin domain-containing protein [Gammaproteobacteria bacterium]